MKIKRVVIGVVFALLLSLTFTPKVKAATQKTATMATESSISAVKKSVAKKTTIKKAKYTKKDLRLMASIIWCEAGNQSYAGKLAVGVVVMNRKKSSAFPNSIKGVIYQRYQFSPTRNGAMKKALRAYDKGKFKSGARAQCLKAAKAALNGQTYVVSKGKKINFKKMKFFSRSLSHAKVRIGAHKFK